MTLLEDVPAQNQHNTTLSSNVCWQTVII